MWTKYFCKKLVGQIELSKERLAHIQDRHPDLILLKPTGEILLIHWFPHVLNGKFLTVVVIIDDSLNRNWIITAFVTRKLPKGDLYA